MTRRTLYFLLYKSIVIVILKFFEDLYTVAFSKIIPIDCGKINKKLTSLLNINHNCIGGNVATIILLAQWAASQLIRAKTSIGDSSEK